MMALPIPWIGVMTSPSTSALRSIAVSGSRCMISGVRNGPMRIVDTNTNNIAAVVARLTMTIQTHPRFVCGMFQSRFASDTATNKAVDDSIEYQGEIGRGQV